MGDPNGYDPTILVAIHEENTLDFMTCWLWAELDEGPRHDTCLAPLERILARI